ncbi:TetR/AcrR family transcriptional regulator, partial [Lactobacillus sp. XV13L]|nr:TetR/AcrR family transcriptional regulator [Lactobacillus sp. XV13L]
MNEGENMSTAKEKIIDAARKLFSEKGVKDTSIRDIAKEAGYSHTMIYSYFDSKQELFALIAIEPLNILYDQFRAIYDLDVTYKEKLSLLCNEYIRFGIEHRSIYPLISVYEGERIDQNKFSNE